MAFTRETIKRNLRSMGASSIRALGVRLAKALGLSRPKTVAEARELATRTAAGAAPPPAQKPATPGAGGGGFRTSPPPILEPPPGDESQLAGGTFKTQAQPPRPGEDQQLSEEILTPQSSNVFAFQYDYSKSMLLVTYKAASLNPSSISKGKSRRKGGRQQLLGRSGKTITGKTNERGPRYGYFDTPVRVFERMKMAASKGKFVWDVLRIRGTIYGHKYRYSLIQGQVTPDVGGVYIPRRATEGGFRTRAVADLGSGKRGFQTSTLPEQRFRSRSAPRK